MSEFYHIITCMNKLRRGEEVGWGRGVVTIIILSLVCSTCNCSLCNVLFSSLILFCWNSDGTPSKIIVIHDQ